VFLLIWMLFSSAIFLIGVKMFLFEPKNVSIQVTEEK
jgi:FtsZ-interacting cell division protein YlmF